MAALESNTGMAATTDRPLGPLLSIAIPTFNRGKYLAESLRALAPQLAGELRVELIISDNSSSDDTQTVVGSFLREGLSCRYIRNESNIGADANFLQCFREARGKYVWLLGDDDILVPGGLAKILPLLETGNYSLVYLNSYSFTSDYQAERMADRFGRFAQKFSDPKHFLRNVGTMIAFISSVIVNKDRYRAERGFNLDDLLGSNLIHLGWLLPLLCSDGTNLVIWARLVAARKDNTEGWGICKVFGESLMNISDTALKGRRDIARELANYTLRNWFPANIVGVRRSRDGRLLHEDMRKLLEPWYRYNWRYWFFVFPVISLPLALASKWYSAINFSNRLGRLLGLAVHYPQWRRSRVREQKSAELQHEKITA